MLRNYLKITFRNFTKNPVISFINVFGLAVGLAICLLIMLYIDDERNYDHHIKDGDRIFRIYSSGSKGGTWAATSAPVAWAAKNQLPEVEQSTRLMTFPDIAKMLLKSESGSTKKKFFESNGYYVDSTFFQIFNYDFLYGNAESALTEPNSIVLSKKLSEKFFGSENPVGKSLLITTPFGEFDYRITGVFDNSKTRSHIPANYLLSMRNKDMWNWVQRQTSYVGNNVFFTYLKLKPGTDKKVAEQKLEALFKKNAGHEMRDAGFSQVLFLQPVKDIYLHSALGNEIATNGNISYLYILGSIGAFILLIACINFMNLATARSEKRAREVGVRKVLGAEKKSLVWQFLGESFLLCFLSLVLALILAETALPYFDQLTQKDIQLFDYPLVVCWIIALTAITGFISGLYPAFYLSSFKPVSIIKGKLKNNFSATAIRKGLVVFQFTISICLMIAAIVIWRQLGFLNAQQLGFQKEQKIILPLGLGYLNSPESYRALKNELVKLPETKMVSSGSTYPGVANLNDMLFYPEGKTTNDAVDVGLAAVSDGFIETLGFSILEGRSFSKDIAADSSSIILNVTAVKHLGYSPGDIIGKKIKFDVKTFHGQMVVVGVVKDFNYESLHSAIKPFGFTTGTFADPYGYVIVSVTSHNYSALIKKIETIWKKTNPAIPFVYSFLDQDFAHNYDKERRISTIVVGFMAVAIVIACLGLFGLAAFSAEQRTKEIGIRKVLGASVTSVTALLSNGFIKLIGLAILIATPLGWWMMNKWLEDFAYQAPINWWIFATAGLLSIAIAVMTVSFHAIRAAMANPVNSLRTD